MIDFLFLKYILFNFKKDKFVYFFIKTKQQLKYFIVFFVKESFLLLDVYDFPFYLNELNLNLKLLNNFYLHILCCPFIGNLKNNS